MKFKNLRKNLTKDYSGFPIVKMAVVADWSTQFLAQALRGLAYERRVDLRVYEGAYGQFETEILDGDSGLYAFAPDFVLLFPSAEALRDRFYDAAEQAPRVVAGFGPDFAETAAARIESLVSRLRARTDAKPIVCNLCELDDAVYGSLGAVRDDALPRVLHAVNERLARNLSADAQGGATAFLVDINALQSVKGRDVAFDSRLYCVSNSVFSLDFLPCVAERILCVADALSGRIRKCLVTDLDGVLWGGIVGEAGTAGIEIGEFGLGRAFSDLQRWIRALARRGVAIAVCSKNDEMTAKEPFLTHPDMILRLEDISVFVANWNDKASNIKHIREILNIGFDSMVFLDDSPAERDLVRRMLPEVVVPELPRDASLVLRTLQEANLFETATVSDEDRRRTAMYKAESLRGEAAAATADVGAYLQSLEMTARFEPFDAYSIPRAAQLTQRTNQFNLRTKRYTDGDLRGMLADEAYITRCLSLTDRFGDYGIVGVVILTREEAGAALFLDTLLLSCRVFLRGVEEFMFNALAALAEAEGATYLTGEYIPTAKNGLVAGLLSDFGFRPEDAGRLRLCVSDYIEKKTYVRKEA
jgi:FkbH-like protein